jgi:CBS domain-containing protein
MSNALIYPTENVGKIMKKPVVTIRPDESARRAAQLMEEKRIGSVVVVEDNQPIGIITERDFVRIAADGHHWDARVGEVMTTPPITCESSKKVTDAFVIMAVNKIDHLPITENGKLVGVVASRDLLTATLV